LAEPTRRHEPPPPRPGEVIRYAYLWTHEADAGAEEGRKNRPCAVVLALARSEGVVEVVVAPITSSAPARSADGVELPTETQRRLGLQDTPCWVVLTEVNRFAWPGPDLRPVESAAGPAWSHGLLPAALFERIRDAIVARARARTLRAVSRQE
jgi:mRNA-degrading endonuclease toxin of MazEF toxin-antitoxin module